MEENYVSVTQVISFVNQNAFQGVPEFLLERAANRGTDVHAIAALYLQGLFFETTAETEGYIQSLSNWVNSFVEGIVFVEKELVSHRLKLKGHADALVRIRGDSGNCLVDWKTPKPLSKSWRLQLAGYYLLAQESGYTNIERVASLRLDAVGGLARFEGYTRNLAADKVVFLSALNVWKFFNL